MLRYRTVLLGLLLVIILLAAIYKLHRETEKRPQVTFMAVGDVLLARGIARKIGANGQDWPLAEVSSLLQSADVAFCNLECPLSVKGIKINKPFCFKADPSNVECLTDAGFDVVSLANNHSLDCGRTGLTETMHYLDKFGIAFCGAGSTLGEAGEPTIIDVKGLRVAFLARNTLYPEGIWLRADKPGAAGLDESSICREIADVRKKADVVIVSVHWGVEYRKKPGQKQIVLARKMVDSGADLVLGHHPHVTQPVERYHGGVIAYSLGNFLFDSTNPKCRESMILKCRLSKSGVSDLEVVPVTITHWRPIPGRHQ